MSHPTARKVSFAHNFGGRASAAHLHSVTIFSLTGRPLQTVVEPSEFRVREDGTVTIYSRRFPQTSVYGIRTANRIITGLPRTSGVDTHVLSF